MRIKRIRLISKRNKVLSVDIQQEYHALKVLHSMLGQTVKLHQLDTMTFKLYHGGIWIHSVPLKIDKDLHEADIRAHQLFPSELADFLYANGAQSATPDQHYRTPVVRKPVGEKRWTRDSKGFWKEEYVPKGY